jgi:transcriptional regulator with XRE-family HTH domain
LSRKKIKGVGKMKFNPEKIKELRDREELSLGTMKRLLEARYNYRVSRATLSCWERGLTEPGLKSLVVLCQFFEVEPNYFFST